jgi:raffinose/stachyose/melibiose transport system substrate-binding protein
MKLKKWMAVLLTIVMSVSLLGGCGKSTGDDKASEQPDGQSSEEGQEEAVTIRILTRIAGTSNQVGIFNQILDEFKAKHPEVTIVDDSQSDESAFNNLMASDIASGNLANIFRIQGVANLADYIDNGLLLDVSEYLEADKDWGSGFTEGSLAYFNVPGHEGTYAIPMESGVIGIYYNKALFSAAGIEKFPETWSELLTAIDKLKATGVIPIAMGAQSSYMAGHLHDQIFYKWVGTNAAKLLGSREKKWTDEDVVQSLQYVKDLIDAGAFDKSAAGLTDDIALSQFQQGDAAMVITGPWNITNFTDETKTPVAKDIDVANFPYFDEKPELKNENMQTLGCYMINGKLEGKEKELTVELIKMLTDKDAAKRFAEEAGVLIPRSDMELDESKCPELLVKNVALGGNSSGVGVDVFDFDPLPSMQDRTRNSIVSMFIDATAQGAAEEIQAEIDSNN